MSMPSLKTRERLSEVRYEIRGELARRARELEAQGRTLVKLNIGNPGAFGFRAPEHLQRAIADRIADTDPYTHQQGLPAAREAIADFHRARGTPNASPERVFVGNGVSELIDLSLRALLNPGDEVLLPSPDYPLWSAATILKRFEYREPALNVLLVRVYERGDPFEIAESPHFAGCKSWVDLRNKLPTSGLTPVLDDAAFDAVTADLRNRLNDV